MTRTLTRLSQAMAVAATVAVIAFALAASAAAGNGHHCPPGSTNGNYCTIVCVPPNVVGEGLGPAIKQIIEANCGVGRITCARANGIAAGWRGQNGCESWRWCGGRSWGRYRRAANWVRVRSNGPADGRGWRPWAGNVIVIAQSPGPGGQYPARTPINLLIAFRPGG